MRVLDFEDANASSDGRNLTRRYLSYLAHHPATARRIARKLAVKFVRDDPSDELVEHLANVYLRSGTQIKPVLRALVETPAFAASVGAKVRDPGEDIVATYRALGVRVDNPRNEKDAANSILWQASSLGSASVLLAASGRAARRLGVLVLAVPAAGVAAGPPGHERRLVAHGSGSPTASRRRGRPEFPVRFETLVDHLSRSMLHRRATSESFSTPAASPSAASLERSSPVTTGHEVADAAPARLRPRLPRLLLQVTSMTRTPATTPATTPARLPASVASEPCCAEYAASRPAGLLVGAAALAGTAHHDRLRRGPSLRCRSPCRRGR